MSSFPIWIPLISFSSLFPLARTFHTMMNKSSESGHTCFVLDLRSAFSFSLSEYDVGCGCVIMRPFIC